MNIIIIFTHFKSLNKQIIECVMIQLKCRKYNKFEKILLNKNNK